MVQRTGRSTRGEVRSGLRDDSTQFSAASGGAGLTRGAQYDSDRTIGRQAAINAVFRIIGFSGPLSGADLARPSMVVTEVARDGRYAVSSTRLEAPEGDGIIPEPGHTNRLHGR
jgi:hypothetical protein